MDPLIALVLATLLAAIFGAAALHKLLDSAGFGAVLTRYQILPASLIFITALALPLIELAIAVSLLFGPTRVVGGMAGAALLAIYALAMSINLLRGRRDLSCGCGWGVSSGHADPTVSMTLVSRNLILVGLALILVLVPPDRSPGGFDLFNGVLGGALVALLWATADRLMANFKLMSLRRQA